MLHLHFILLLFHPALAFLRWIHPCDVGQLRCKCFTSSAPALSVCWEQRGRWNELGSLGHRCGRRAATSFPLVVPTMGWTMWQEQWGHVTACAWLSFPRQPWAMAARFQGVSLLISPPSIPHSTLRQASGGYKPEVLHLQPLALGIYWTL